MSNEAQELGEGDTGEPPSEKIESILPLYVRRCILELDESDGTLAGAVFTNNDGVTLRVFGADNALSLSAEVAQVALERMPSGSRVREDLCDRMSKTMSEVARRQGLRDVEHRVFIGSPEGGTLWAVPLSGNTESRLTSARYGSKKESLWIKSEGVETIAELKVLLGGLAVCLAELETKKSPSVDGITLQ